VQVIVRRPRRNNKGVNQANGPNRIDVQILSQTRINSTKGGYSSQATQHMKVKQLKASSLEVFINLTYFFFLLLIHAHYPSPMLTLDIPFNVNIKRHVKIEREKEDMQVTLKRKIKQRKCTLGCLPSSASLRSLARP